MLTNYQSNLLQCNQLLLANSKVSLQDNSITQPTSLSLMSGMLLAILPCTVSDTLMANAAAH
jgi:hypothetical protein